MEAEQPVELVKPLQLEMKAELDRCTNSARSGETTSEMVKSNPTVAFNRGLALWLAWPIKSRPEIGQRQVDDEEPTAG